MEFEKSLIYLGYFILFINFILYSKSFNKNSKAFRVIVFYLFFTLVIQIISDFLAREKMNNLFLSHYYFIGQFILLGVFYFKILKNSLKKIIPVISVVVLSILAYKFIFNPELYYSFLLLEVVVCSLPIVLYSIFYFMESFGVENKKFLLLNSGVFIYLLSSTLIFSSGNIVTNLDAKTTEIIWLFNSILYVVYQFLIFAEWYKNFRKPLPKT